MQRAFTIRGKTISDDSSAYVIAEIGHNHMGNVNLAFQMIATAADYGADAVKLQKRSPAFYDALRAKGLTEYAEIREARELDAFKYAMLSSYAHSLDLAFIVTAFDVESLVFLAGNVDAIKLASGSVYNHALLDAAAKTGLPLLLSTGCADLSDVQRGIEVFCGRVDVEVSRLALLQCTSQYPCHPANLNLGVIESYRHDYPGTVVGLSSHHPDNTYEPLAYRLGARIFEKHFTLDRNMGEGDHKNSLEPDDLRDLVERLKRPCPDYDPDEYLMVYGDREKRRLDCEAEGMRRLNPWGTPDDSIESSKQTIREEIQEIGY